MSAKTLKEILGRQSARFDHYFEREDKKIIVRFFDWRITAFDAETNEILEDKQGGGMDTIPITDTLEEQGFKETAVYALCDICETPTRIELNRYHDPNLDYQTRLWLSYNSASKERIAKYEHDKIFHPEIAVNTKRLPKLRLYKDGKFVKWIKYQDADNYKTPEFKTVNIDTVGGKENFRSW